MKVTLIGALSYSVYKIGNKTIYSWGENHSILQFAEEVLKLGNKVMLYAWLENIFLHHKDEQVHMFFEIGLDAEFPFINYILNSKTHKEGSNHDTTAFCANHIQSVFNNYIYGMYKNYLQMIGSHILPESKDLVDKDSFADQFNINAIPKSNFHKNISFHLTDHRAFGFFNIHQEEKYDQTILKRVREGPLNEIDIIIGKKDLMMEAGLLKCKDGMYSTYIDDMYKKISIKWRERIDKFLIDKVKISSLQSILMDYIAIIKLVFYLNEDSHVDGIELDDTADVIILYGGYAHIFVYGEFLKFHFNDMKVDIEIDGPYSSKEIPKPSFDKVVHRDVELKIDEDYVRYINIPKYYNNHYININFSLQELDLDYLSLFINRDDISNVDAQSILQNLHYVKKSVDAFLMSKDDDKTDNLYDESRYISISIKYGIEYFISIISLLHVLSYTESKNLSVSIIKQLDKFLLMIDKNDIDSWKRVNEIIKSKGPPPNFPRRGNFSSIYRSAGVYLSDLRSGESTMMNIHSFLKHINNTTLGGGNQTMKYIEALEFDAITGTSEFLRNIANREEPSINTMPYQQSISVYGGYSNIQILFCLVVVSFIICIFIIFLQQPCSTEISQPSTRNIYSIT